MAFSLSRLFGGKKKQSRLAAPQTIAGRVSALLRANIHAALDAAEDPELVLDQFVRDFTATVLDAENAVAETVGHVRLMESESETALMDVDLWGQRALAATKRADVARSKGKGAEAARLDDLAREAVTKQIKAEDRVKALAPTIEAQNLSVEQLKQGLNGMRGKLSELKTKRSELIARTRTVEAQEKVIDAVRAVNVSDPTSELGRVEDSVRRREALVQGRAEVAASSMDAQFSELDDIGTVSRVEERLAAIQSGARVPAGMERS